MLKKIWYWLFSLNERKPPPENLLEKLQLSMRITAACRYNAAVRLIHQGKFAFFTTTILSLGLIFIPLMQNAGIELRFNPNVLNMMVIFLAVSVLVYSVVIGTARHELRAENLTECGDKLKELIREIDSDIQKDSTDSILLAKYLTRYSDIVTDTENHNRSDYKLAMLEMKSDYHITGIVRLYYYIHSYMMLAIPYIVPFLLITFEITFITDMIGITEFLSPFLK